MNIFDAALMDIRSAMNKSKAETRTYNRTQTPEKYYQPEYARFKLVIYFKDGRSRWYYSYDLQKFQNSQHIDEFNSMVKLIRIVKNNIGEFKTAILYATSELKPATASANFNYMVAKWDWYGNSLENQFINFRLHGADNKLDLYYLSQGQKVLTKKTE